MNKVLVGFNVILAAAVVYLFVARPGNGEEETEPQKETKTEVKTGTSTVFKANKGDGELRVAFIQADTLSARYDFFKQVEMEINMKSEQIGKELQAKEKQLMGASQRIQKDFELKTKSEQEQAYMQMQNLEMNYQKFKEEKMRELDDLRNSNLSKADDALKKFLKTYCAENKIDFVLRDGLTGSMFYGNTIYDITEDVAKGLNAEYKKGK